MSGVVLTFVYSSKTDSGDYARFISEMGRHNGREVQIIDGALSDAPSTGFVLFAGADVRVALNECPEGIRSELASRLVAVGGTRPKILEKVVEPLSLAGAIDSMSFLEWKVQGTTLGAWGLYGRKDLAERIGARCLLYKSARYCYLHSPTHDGLPHLVVDYLGALDASDRP
jgi:hypothetical protein